MAVRVLIVDDDVFFRDVIDAALEDRGYDVVGRAGTLAEARDAVGRLRPDAMLLDVHLPDGNGLAFLEELRDERLRVLLTSSDPDAAPAGTLGRTGAAGFVPKTQLLVTDLTPYLG